MEELSESMYRCRVCNETLSKFALKKHSKRYHATSKPYNCELCSFGCHRLDERLSHMNENHPDSLKCTVCNIQFYSSDNYVDHMRSSHNKQVAMRAAKSRTEIDVPLQRLRFVPRRVEESSTRTEIVSQIYL
jgi:uncharacterized short protein YbdD (DUF466 family)